MQNFINLESIPAHIDILLKEYEQSQVGSATYFDYMYRTIGFFVSALAIILVYSIRDARGHTYSFIFSLVLPVIGYIFGLFYCYNAVAITKLAYFQKICEEKIKFLLVLKYKTISFIGWTNFADSNRDMLLLPYGTLLMLFILFPIMCIWLSYNDLSNKSFHILPPKIDFLFTLSCIFYVIFIVFMILQIRYIVLTLKKIKKVKVKIKHMHDYVHIVAS